MTVSVLVPAKVAAPETVLVGPEAAGAAAGAEAVPPAGAGSLLPPPQATRSASAQRARSTGSLFLFIRKNLLGVVRKGVSDQSAGRPAGAIMSQGVPGLPEQT